MITEQVCPISTIIIYDDLKKRTGSNMFTTHQKKKHFLHRLRRYKTTEGKFLCYPLFTSNFQLNEEKIVFHGANNPPVTDW